MIRNSRWAPITARCGLCLRSMYDRGGGKIFTIGGFLPWAWKYSNSPGAGSRHGGVASEWQYAHIISAYNGTMDADALGYSGMSNASFYQHFPLADHYAQRSRTTLADVKAEGLIDGEGHVAPLRNT